MMHISFPRLFFVLSTVLALFAILILAKMVLIPLGLALLIAFILFPLTKKYESWGMHKMFAAFLSLFTLFLIIGGILFFFSTQIMGLSQVFSDFREKIMGLFTDVIFYINRNVSLIPNLERDDLLSRVRHWLTESAASLAGKTFNSTATLLAQLLSMLVYTFLILLYRNGLTHALLEFSPEEKREQVFMLFKRVQRVGQKYLSGLLILITFLGFANSIGLWIIGLDKPFLFGFLAAVFSIIPYIGTLSGASIPILYAFMSYDSLWTPLAVIILFWSVQLIEDNVLSPKIVGSSIKVNALAAILSLIVGGLVWGIAGMILFLPFTAMLKVICEEVEELKPIALLLGTSNYRNNNNGKHTGKKWLEKIKGGISRIHKPKNAA